MMTSGTPPVRDRRLGLAPLLVVLLALSGGPAMPQRSAGPLRPDTSIAWNQSERRAVPVLAEPTPPARPGAATTVDRPDEHAISTALPLWVFQRPPPSPVFAV